MKNVGKIMALLLMTFLAAPILFGPARLSADTPLHNGAGYPGQFNEGSPSTTTTTDDDGKGGGPGSGSGGSGPHAPPPPPPEVDAAVQEAIDTKVESAHGLGGDGVPVAAGASDPLAGSDGSSVATGSITATTNEENGRTNSSLSGDPVLATTGSYVFDVTDYEIGGGIDIKRKYISEEKTVGSIGTGWLLTIDSRILRGWERVNTSAIKYSEAQLDKAEEYIKQIQKEALALKEMAQSDDIKPNDRDITREAAEKAFNEMMSQANAIYDAGQAARTEIKRLNSIMAHSEKIAALNRYSSFRGSPSNYETVGSGYLVLIDEDGTPGVFEPAGTGVWLPMSSPRRLYERLETLDGGGIDSKAGFVLYGHGGRNKFYNGNGMLIAVTELNGNRVDITRDNEEKVTMVTGPHGNTWTVEYSGDFISTIKGPEGTEVKYGYNGDELAWVTDKEGDTGSYNYSAGRLKAIVKPDGSAIQIDYGYTGSGGVLLVTTTTHEEGSSERFEYNPSQMATTYTNHSGVVTRYFYDGGHRTVQEEHSDGRIKTFAYNPYGLLEYETLNGFAIQYSYDGHCNITEKLYGDGKRENWEWNENDQVVKYTDRDGIVTEWRYDSQWNNVEVRRGGQVVFTASYDSQNRLVTSRELNRPEFKYEYDGHDFVKSRSFTVNGSELREQWQNDALGRVKKYTDVLGRVWEYTYNAKDTIEKAPTGLERRYEYNNRKDLVKITEKDTKTGEVREQSFGYDKRHLLLESTDGSGIVTKYAYRADGELARMEQGPWYREYGYEAGGRVSTVTMGKTGSDGKYTENYRYAWQGWNEERMVTKGDAGTTAYLLNPFGQVTSVTNALGETSSRTLNGAGNPLREQGASGGFYTYRYDTLGRPIEASREGEKAVQARYNLDGSVAEMTDRVGNVTRYSYDGRGLLEKEISALGEERYFYDIAGRVIRHETVSRNSVTYRTEWVYNDSQRTVTVTAGGVYTETLYLNAWNEVVRRVDGEGNETRYEYDKAGKLVKATDGYGKNTYYGWNELGKVAKVTYANNATESYEYNYMGSLAEIRDALGVSWSGEYDEAGRLYKETGRPGLNREYKYDQLGRIVEIKNGGEVVEKYRYTNRGREVVFTDGAGRNFTQQKNAFGEFTGENNRLGDSQKYAYDAEGRAVSRTSYSGKATKVEYRDAEGITITTYADGTQNIIERDLSGNIVRAANEIGTIRYKYDAGGKLIEQTDESAGEVTHYAYDKAGRRVRMQSVNRDVQYRYGKNGELLYVQDHIQRLEVSYEYDVRGMETRRVYGNGVKQETLYDQAGRVILIRESDSMNRLLRAEGYVYDAQGRRSHSVNEEGQVTKYEYDAQSRLSAVLYPWTKEKAEADMAEAEEAGLYFTPEKGNGERYSFSSAEQAALREVLDKAGPARGNAVSGSQLVWREAYTYDRNGNRATKTTPWGVIKYEYDAENRLVKKGDIEYINDRDGNTLSERGLRYEAKYQYNAQNRMVYSQVTSHVEKTHTVNYYGYDALGRRALTESITGETLRTLYDGGSFEVIREGESLRDGNLTTRNAPAEAMANALSGQAPSAAQASSTAQALGERYRWVTDGDAGRARGAEGYAVQGGRFAGRGVTLYGNGEAVALSYSSGAGGRMMYLGKDIMGSVRSVTVDTGALEGRYEYDAFGQPYKGDLSGGMNLGYTGKPYDTATGLYNYGYRDYKPQAARFTTVDPIRDGSNWFAYVNNDPVNWRDPFGLQSIGINQNAMNLSSVQSTTRNTPMYQQGGGGRYPSATTPTSTFCNQATFDVATATGFNTSALYGTSASGNINNRDQINANTAAQNLADAATQGTVVQITGGQAQALADQGYTVVAAWENPNPDNSGHLTTVAPDLSPTANNIYPNNYDPTVSNVGGKNGLMSASDAFGLNNIPSYYYDPKQQFDEFDPSMVAQRQEQSKPKKND